MKNPSSKLTRMRLDLEEYNFEVQYVKGKENVGPDALSRVKIDSENLKNINVLRVETRAMKQKHNQKQNQPSEVRQLEDRATDHPRVFEVLSQTEVTNIPELRIKVSSEKLSLTTNWEVIKRNNTHAKHIINMKENQLELALAQGFTWLEKEVLRLHSLGVKLSTENNIFNVIDITKFKKVGNQFLKEITVAIYRPLIRVNEENEIEEILKAYHNSPLGGHVGKSRMYKRLKQIYSWKGMRRSVSNHVGKCVLCKRNKHLQKTKEALVITPTPAKAVEIMSIDTVGPFPRSAKGNRYAVTLQCELTKYVVVIPTTDKEASTIARAVVNEFILIYGPMSKLKSDLGTEYCNRIFAEICKLLGVSQLFATAAHPETIGALERNHKCLNEYLRCFVNDSKDDWDEWCKYYEFCYNTTPNSVHGYTPFELIFGRKATIPPNLDGQHAEPIYDYELYENELKFRIQKSISNAKRYIEKAKKTRKVDFDSEIHPIALHPGDKVLVSNENRKKLDPLYTGPREVVAVEGVNCKIKDAKGSITTVHKNRLRLT